ncbi:MAG: hypothetical protein IJK89_09970 [Clostridia bacterium]|nr:hypothetical protein [Clostridia bacterium]
MKKHFGGVCRLLALVLTAALLMGIVGAQAFAAGGNAGLTDAFWDYLTENAKKGVSSVDVSQFGVTYSDEVKKAISSFLFEESVELFNVQAPVGYSIGNGTLVSVNLNFNCTVSEYQARLKKAEAAAADLLKGIKGNSALSDVQKALLLHDRLAVHCEYDRGVYTSAGPGVNARNIYGGLVERCAVCDGYTKTYIYLLRQVGIKSVMNRSDALNHSWNIVYIGGKPYHVDVTFDDPTHDKTGRVAHDNFLLSSAALYKTKHAASDYDTSPTDTRYDNYFWQDSFASFVLAGGSIYYIDNINCSLNRYDGRKLFALSEDWNGWYEVGKRNVFCMARLATDGTFLFYNDKRSVYKYDPSTGKTETVFTPADGSGQKMILGMTWEKGKFICDFTDSLNNYSQGKKSFQVTKDYAGVAPAVLPGDVNGDNKVGSDDARLALRASVGLENIKKGAAAFTAADVTKDGKIGSDDARLILRASVGLEKL